MLQSLIARHMAVETGVHAALKHMGGGLIEQDMERSLHMVHADKRVLLKMQLRS
jgi:hypothetical protein